MFEIDEQHLKNMCGNKIYTRGLDMYLRNKVRRIDTNIEKDEWSGDNVLFIEALVESSYANENYEVELLLSDKTNRLRYGCNCQYAEDTNSICKHVVAVLLKWNREKSNLMKQYGALSKSKTNQFIEYMKNAMLNNQKDFKELKIDIKYELEAYGRRNSSIELKVGEDRTYVVKNMKAFLQAVSDMGELEFGKGFTFNAFIHGFTNEDKQLIDFLLEIYEIDMKVSSYSNTFSRTFGNFSGLMSGKKIYLTDIQVKRFFNIVKNKSFDAVINGVSLSNTKIIHEDMPLEFNLKLSYNSMVIHQGKDLPLPITDDGEYFFYNNAIYHPSSSQSKLYKPFYNEIANSKSGQIVFSKDDLENAVSYIIPSIKTISKNIKIDEKFKEKFYEEALNISVYLDKEDEGISADVVFQYGDFKINPLVDKNISDNNKVIIRNVGRELEFTRVLESMAFTTEKNKYVLKDEEALIDFMTNGISRLQEISELYYSEAFKGIKVYNSSNIKSVVRLNEEDFLEFSFSIEGVDRKELKEVLSALKQKKKYYKLKKGGFVSLQSKEMQDMSSMIEFLDIKDADLDKDKILLSKYNALYLDQSLKGSSMIQVERNKRFRELVNNIKEVQELEFKLPEHLEGIMRGYQKFGFKWLKTLASCGFGGILADEMGLGKTLQTIAFIESEVMERGENRKPSLVVAPTSLVYNWKSEIEKFAPSLKALVISGAKDKREEKRKEIEEAHIVITSYPLIRRDIEEYKGIKFRYCILDEAQQIKNPSSINAQSVKEINAEGYFALTGTPIENSLTELWSIFDFIMPGYLLSHGKFTKKYETPIVKNKDTKALEDLNKHIKPFILRRLKREVVKELPPKIEHKLIVEMTEEQKKLYAAYIAEAKAEIDNEIREKGFNKSKIKILSTLTRLRQICCDPSIFADNYEGESGKLEALDNILEESINEGHRILLFSQFTTVLKNIEKRLAENNIEYMYLDGQTKIEDRGRMVKEFNEGKGSIFLISLKAGGTGLNLTGADVVIHFDPWWNPAVEDQATDRAHRIGQEKTVEVIKLIAQGTIEEKIYNLQEKKKDIINSVMSEESGEESLISQMSQEEIEELFKL
ncbi:DEAD/DEAH box helicase [Clostridium sp. SYSU_GA19001]|uniref:DEAD/DEAH box helicase n=1 Tax=Clostridium caldaquaticum TaxID=2940653 RepID=UPI002076DCF1|nr:DEAD/DEAH box helicase [Clostridium caldaquaticum]MCM8709461.1 DEAD/DEAH box helicase [Clostridium caldaquaticum]